MIKKQKGATVSGGLILTLVFLIGASPGCNMPGGESARKNGADDAKTAKSIPATQICQTLAHPSFENRSPYNGQSCSGSTFFGARDTRTGPSETDTRPAFSYAAIGEQDAITSVRLSMSKRADGAEFFAAQGDAVAKLINGQPLPNEIRNAITSPLAASGGDFTTASQIGNAKVKLVRSAADSRFDLSFEF